MAQGITSRLTARLALIWLLLGTGAANAAASERLSIVANGEVVGTLVAVSDVSRISIDYRVDNNGRGPKHHQELVLDAAGMPVSLVTSGTSLMGGPVAESYRWQDGVARWTSQADAGEAEAARPMPYIVNDDNPYVVGVYARAVLASNSDVVAVLPAGRLQLTRLREMVIGSGARATPVTVYRLTGVQLAPTYLMLDRHQRLFATFGGSEVGTAVRAGYETEADALAVLGDTLETERVQALQQRLAHRFDAPVRITNVRVFDPRRGTLSPLSTVVVMRESIVQLLPDDTAPAPSDEVVIDGEGGTLLPGLHDMHSHATLDSGLMYLAAGVTGTRDMGNDNRFMLDLLAKIDAGTVAWPRIVPSGFIEGRSAYSARHGIIPETPEQAIAAVRWYADHGYPEIKIYNSFNPDWVAPVAAEAHRRGLRVAGHVPAFSSPDRVIGDGYDTIAHVNQLMLGWILNPGDDTRTPLRLTAMARAGSLDLTSPRVQHTVRLMQAHGTALDTTAVILEILMLSRAGEVPAFAQDFIDHMPIGYQRYRKRSYVTLAGPADDADYRAGFAKVLDVIALLHKAGVRLLPGTDDTTGFTLLRELELYVRAGLTPAEALRTATLGAAEYFGQADRQGSIEPGKFADMVLVAGDPTRDITAIKRPRMVLKGGTVYFPSEIYDALGIRPFTTPPPMRPAAAVSAVPAGSAADHGAGRAGERHD